jgi:hypothetical protein
MKLQTLVSLGLAALMAGSTAWAGIQYEGERNAFNRFHGKGKFTSSRGEVYDGNWVDGSREGHGVFTTPAGDRYDGNWANNQENGQGKMTWANGDAYDGNWVAGKMQGEGTFITAKGDVYKGNFSANQRQGKGVLTTPAGEKFDGTWKAGKKSGEFHVSLKDGTAATGHWTEDRAPATAMVDLPDGIKYNGPVRNGILPAGKGQCTKAGQTTPCEFKDGKLVVAEAPKPEPKPAPKVEPKPAPVAVVAAPVVPAAVAKPVEPPKPKDPRTGRGTRTDGTQFFFKHNYGAGGTSDNLPKLKVEKNLNESSAMRITAKGGDFDVTIIVDEYLGVGTYELKYFKAWIQKKGEDTSYWTLAAEQGKLEILKDEGGKLIGLFSFTGYPNGNVGNDKRVVSEGEFVIPAK